MLGMIQTSSRAEYMYPASEMSGPIAKLQGIPSSGGPLHLPCWSIKMLKYPLRRGVGECVTLPGNLAIHLEERQLY